MPLWQHPGVDGVVFTGSKAVGMRIHAGLSARWIKPCLLELGGKNAAIVVPSADLDAAAEGVMRSAFSLQNQKCSATSRVYVHRDGRGAVHGAAPREDPRDPDGRSLRAGRLLRSGHQRTRGRALRARRGPGAEGGDDRRWAGSGSPAVSSTGGTTSRPPIARLPLDSSLFREELFVPFLAVGEVGEPRPGDCARRTAAEYGLTAGIFSGDTTEVARFFDEIEAGVCYANKRTGATTGAWPGAQAFCGWKGSGSTGKGGCGPYYVAAVHAGAEPDGDRTSLKRKRTPVQRTHARLPQDRGSASRARRPRRSSTGTRSGPPPATSRNIRWSSPGAGAPWWRTWTATGTSTSWPGSRSPPPDTVIPRWSPR